MQLLNLLVLCLGYILNSIHCSEYIHQLRLYSGYDCTGVFYTLEELEYVDLGEIGFSNVVHSVKVEAAYLFYDLENYNYYNRRAAVEYVQSKTYACKNLNETSGIVSSLRAVGYNAYYSGRTYDSIDFFALQNFRGTKETVYESTGSLVNSTHESAIIIPFESHPDWTVYNEDDYGGAAFCLDVQGTWDNPWLIPDFQQLDPPIPYGFIQSVRETCMAKHNSQIISSSSN